MVREQNGSRKSSGQAGAVQDCDGHALAPPAGKRKSTHQDATNPTDAEPSAAPVLVHGNPSEPRWQTRAAAEAVEVVKGTDISFLNDVLGFAAVAKNATSNPA